MHIRDVPVAAAPTPDTVATGSSQSQGQSQASQPISKKRQRSPSASSTGSSSSYEDDSGSEVERYQKPIASQSSTSRPEKTIERMQEEAVQLMVQFPPDPLAADLPKVGDIFATPEEFAAACHSKVPASAPWRLKTIQKSHRKSEPGSHDARSGIGFTEFGCSKSSASRSRRHIIDTDRTTHADHRGAIADLCTGRCCLSETGRC